MSGRGRVGRLISLDGGCVRVLWSVCFCSCMVCAACVMNHVSVLRSGVCLSIWHLSFSDKPRAGVAPGWNPMRSSLMEAFGFRGMYLKKRRPVPGIPACIRNAGECGCPTILGIAICCGGSGGVWLVYLLRVLESSCLCSPMKEVGLF